MKGSCWGLIVGEGIGIPGVVGVVGCVRSCVDRDRVDVGDGFPTPRFSGRAASSALQRKESLNGMRGRSFRVVNECDGQPVVERPFVLRLRI